MSNEQTQSVTQHDVRRHVIGVRVTDAEHARFAIAAERNGLRPSAWLRMLGRQAIENAARDALKGLG